MRYSIHANYVTGRTWTTYAFYRETMEEIERRRNEGCVAVEMEFSACQAVCDYEGIDLYAFLYRADNVDSDTWEKGQRDSGLALDERFRVVNLAYQIADRVSAKQL